MSVLIDNGVNLCETWKKTFFRAFIYSLLFVSVFVECLFYWVAWSMRSTNESLIMLAKRHFVITIRSKQCGIALILCFLCPELSAQKVTSRSMRKDVSTLYRQAKPLNNKISYSGQWIQRCCFFSWLLRRTQQMQQKTPNAGALMIKRVMCECNKEKSVRSATLAKKQLKPKE